MKDLNPLLKSATNEEIEIKFRYARLYPLFFYPLFYLSSVLFFIMPLIYDLVIHRISIIRYIYQYSNDEFMIALLAPFGLYFIYMGFVNYYIEKEILNYNKRN